MTGIFIALNMYICHPYGTDYVKIVQNNVLTWWS